MLLKIVSRELSHQIFQSRFWLSPWTCPGVSNQVKEKEKSKELPRDETNVWVHEFRINTWEVFKKLMETKLTFLWKKISMKFDFLKIQDSLCNTVDQATYLPHWHPLAPVPATVLGKTTDDGPRIIHIGNSNGVVDFWFWFGPVQVLMWMDDLILFPPLPSCHFAFWTKGRQRKRDGVIYGEIFHPLAAPQMAALTRTGPGQSSESKASFRSLLWV